MTPLPRDQRTLWPRLLNGALLVFLGGMLGTLLRISFTVDNLKFDDFVMTDSTNLIGTMFANTLGTFTLALIAGVRAGQPATAKGDAAWLFFAVGLLGGFTSYSAVATIVAINLDHGNLLWLETGMLTVLFGLAAAALGWWLGRTFGRRANSGRA